ncbi:sporozoite surface protein 2-like isoform X2 [Trachinotus anak]|uniref:sporozoite surface protein 2-like isoform X2 n=1 Tax=Trachinotus anak TaxID=443729 RepID=UPI0039F25FEB
MVSGFCVRVLLLSLLAFGPHAKALSYRGGGSSGIKPYFDLAEDSTSSHKPGLASPGYESSAQPGGFLGGSGPSYPDSGSFENQKPAVAGGHSGSYDRQVDGYSQEGSVSSYRPSKPRANPQQPHDQTDLNPNVPQTKAGMWDFALPENGNRFESSIASNYGIKMDSARQSETRPQQPSYPGKPQPQPQPRPQQPSYPGKPQPQPQPRPQQPSYPGKPQPQPQPRPQQPSYNMVQSKVGMWDLAQEHDASYSEEPTDAQIKPRAYPYTWLTQPSKPQPRPQQPSYPGKPQPRPQQPSYPGKPQPRPQQPSYPGKPQPRPQQPSYPGKPQPRPQQPSYPGKPQPRPQQPSYPGKPQPRPQQPSY